MVLLGLFLACFVVLGNGADRRQTVANCQGFGGRQKRSESLRLTCSLSNVCWDGRQWAPAAPDLGVLWMSEPIDSLQVNLGSYESSPLFKLNEQAELREEQEQVWHRDRPALLVWGSNRMYWHWIADELFSMWWLAQHWGVGGDPEGDPAPLELVYVDRATPFADQAQHVFGNAPLTVVGPGDARRRCFEQLLLGPAGHQLGGPGTYLVGEGHVEQYARWVLAQYPEETGDASQNEGAFNVVFEVRSTSRRILNMDAMRQAVESADYAAAGRPVRFHFVSFGDLTHREQFQLLRRTDLLVAVHGSMMANALFLPPDAAVLELFPYGFTRPTFEYLIRRFLKHRPVRYWSWSNKDKSTTTFYPDKYLKGLPEDQRAAIVEADRFDTSSMPWAANLYWINQDQVIDPQLIIPIISAIIEQHPKSKLKTEL